MGLAWFTTYSVFMLTQVLYEDISLSTKLLLSLISNTAMGYAFQLMIMCEGTSRGKNPLTMYLTLSIIIYVLSITGVSTLLPRLDCILFVIYSVP